MTELYRSATLAVRHVPAGDTTRLVVTFDNLGEAADLDRPGFGERFFREHEVAAVHVIGAGNDWYQYPDIDAAMAAVAALAAGYGRVMTYGSSMGGYAAIRLAAAAGAHAILALSPQYAILPTIAPFDSRWSEHAARIDWSPAALGPIATPAVPVIAFDPAGADGAQAALVARDVATVPIALPFVGHPATTFLQNVGLLMPLVFAVLADTLDPAAFQAEALARRRGSSAYMAALAVRQLPQRPRTAIALADRALAIEPGIETALSANARALSLLGRHAEALALHREVIAKVGERGDYSIAYAEALADAGYIAASAALTERLLVQDNARAHLHAWRGTLHWMLHEEAAAFAAVHRALALDPGNVHYRRTLAYYDAHRLLRDAKWRWVGGAPVRRWLHPLVRRIRRRLGYVAPPQPRAPPGP